MLPWLVPFHDFADGQAGEEFRKPSQLGGANREANPRTWLSFESSNAEEPGPLG